MKEEANSLIICTTPLQILIAEKIIELSSNKSFDLIVLVPSNNKKYEYYFNRLRNKCRRSLYYIMKNGVFGFIDFVKTVKFKKFDSNYLNIYLASIDSSYCQYILSKNKNPNIFTFDDGTANIVDNSIYYKITYQSKIKKFARKLFGINYTMNDIKNNSILHYTIYSGIPNIITNTKVINFIDDHSSKNNIMDLKSNDVNIYLGQPLSEITSYFTSEKLIQILSKLNITHYFPHPRELSIPNGNYNIIKSDLIFEDYIIKFLEDHPNQSINIYSFTSTAILNIANLRQVKLYCIFHTELDIRLNNFYYLASEKFSIPLFTITD